MSVTGFNLRSFPVSRSGLFMPSLQNPVTVFNQASGAGMCIPGDALPPGAARRRRRAGGRPGLFPREAKLDPSQLLAQQISPRTELPESRGLRYTGWTFPEAVPGLAAIPGGCTALPALLILPRSPGRSIHGHCTSLSLWESIPEPQPPAHPEPDSSLFQGKPGRCCFSPGARRRGTNPAAAEGFYPEVLGTGAQSWLQDSQEVNPKGDGPTGNPGAPHLQNPPPHGAQSSLNPVETLMGSMGIITGDLGTFQPHQNLFPWEHLAHPVQDGPPQAGKSRTQPRHKSHAQVCSTEISLSPR